MAAGGQSSSRNKRKSLPLLPQRQQHKHECGRPQLVPQAASTQALLMCAYTKRYQWNRKNNGVYNH